MKGLKINVKAAQQIKGEDLEVRSCMRKDRDNKGECTKIYENIYLSCYRNSIDYNFISTNCFTHIINCASTSKNYSPQYFDGLEYLSLDLKDDPGFDIIYAIFCCVDFIENAIKKHGKILIHCFEGISRAPALLASYIMWKDNISKDLAIKFIKEKRKSVEINLGFLVQLNKWEELLNNDKEHKLYKFEKSGNLTLVDKNEASDVVFNDAVSILLLLHENKFYKIFNNFDNVITNKVNNFIQLLQTYRNYPLITESLYVDNQMISKNFIFNNLEEIFKYSCYLQN